MKIALCYAKIPDSSEYPLKQCIMFEKYDGTNIHWLWRNQFTHFGVRRNRYALNEDGVREFTNEHRELAGLVDVFDAKLRPIEAYLASKYADQEVVLFTEYFGEHSFAGEHDARDEKHLILFDCSVDGELLPPDRFLGEFAAMQGVRTARVVYRGAYNGSVSDRVREGKFNVAEGVVIKGCVGGKIHMAKIKTIEYQKRLKERFGTNWINYWE